MKQLLRIIAGLIVWIIVLFVGAVVSASLKLSAWGIALAFLLSLVALAGTIISLTPKSERPDTKDLDLVICAVSAVTGGIYLLGGLLTTAGFLIASGLALLAIALGAYLYHRRKKRD